MKNLLKMLRKLVAVPVVFKDLEKSDIDTKCIKIADIDIWQAEDAVPYANFISKKYRVNVYIERYRYGRTIYIKNEEIAKEIKKTAISGYRYWREEKNKK